MKPGRALQRSAGYAGHLPEYKEALTRLFVRHPRLLEDTGTPSTVVREQADLIAH